MTKKQVPVLTEEQEESKFVSDIGNLLYEYDLLSEQLEPNEEQLRLKKSFFNTLKGIESKIESKCDIETLYEYVHELVCSFQQEIESIEKQNQPIIDKMRNNGEAIRKAFKDAGHEEVLNRLVDEWRSKHESTSEE